MAAAATRIAYLALSRIPEDAHGWYWEEVAVQAAPSYEREVVGQIWDDETTAVFVFRAAGATGRPTLIAVWLSRTLRVPVMAAESDLGTGATLLTMARRMFAGGMVLPARPAKSHPPEIRANV